MLIQCLSNAKDRSGHTALVEFSNEGDFIATHWLLHFLAQFGDQRW